MKRSIIFITGTDTNVGKTILACVLTRFLHRAGISVAALKPVCSGGRDDAIALRAAANAALSLDEVNPWHFPEALSPSLAARRQNRKVRLAQVVAHVRAIRRKIPVVIVEGAGGLLSPLGDDFDSRDLIVALRAIPLVVCPNRLGAVNQVRLVLAALPQKMSERAQIILAAQPRRDAASRSNPGLLGEIVGRERVHVLPRLHVSAAGELSPKTWPFCKQVLKRIAPMAPA